MHTLPFQRSCSLHARGTPRATRSRLVCASSDAPTSHSHNEIVNDGSDRASFSAARRHLLHTALLAGAAAFIPRPVEAKVSIASVKKAPEGERDVEVTASGIRMSLVSRGGGDPPTSGALVLVDVVGSLEDGTVFLDTRKEGGAPLAFQLGTTNKYVPEGLSQVVETMRGGDVKLAVVPPSLGYGSRGVSFKSGSRVPPDAALYYEVNLLRCQTLAVGLACCKDADYPCIKNPNEDINFAT